MHKVYWPKCLISVPQNQHNRQVTTAHTNILRFTGQFDIHIMRVIFSFICYAPTSFTASKPASTPAAVTAAPPVAVAAKVEKTMPQVPEEDCNQVAGQGDIQPVGHDYVEKVSQENRLDLCLQKVAIYFVPQMTSIIFFRCVTLMAKSFDSTVNYVNAASMTQMLKTCTWREEDTDCSTR